MGILEHFAEKNLGILEFICYLRPEIRFYYEVKSSGYKTHASLDAFCHKFSDRISNRYLIYGKDFHKDEATTMLPVFMTMFL